MRPQIKFANRHHLQLLIWMGRRNPNDQLCAILYCPSWYILLHRHWSLVYWKYLPKRNNWKGVYTLACSYFSYIFFSFCLNRYTTKESNESVCLHSLSTYIWICIILPPFTYSLHAMHAQSTGFWYILFFSQPANQVLAKRTTSKLNPPHIQPEYIRKRYCIIIVIRQTMHADTKKTKYIGEKRLVDNSNCDMCRKYNTIRNRIANRTNKQGWFLCILLLIHFVVSLALSLAPFYVAENLFIIYYRYPYARETRFRILKDERKNRPFRLNTALSLFHTKYTTTWYTHKPIRKHFSIQLNNVDRVDISVYHRLCAVCIVYIYRILSLNNVWFWFEAHHQLHFFLLEK